MLDSIDHMTLKIIKRMHFCVKTSRVSPYSTQRYYWRHNVSGGLSILLHDFISLSDATSSPMFLFWERGRCGVQEFFVKGVQLFMKF